MQARTNTRLSVWMGFNLHVQMGFNLHKYTLSWSYFNLGNHAFKYTRVSKVKSKVSTMSKTCIHKDCFQSRFTAVDHHTEARRRHGITFVIALCLELRYKIHLPNCVWSNADYYYFLMKETRCKIKDEHLNIQINIRIVYLADQLIGTTAGSIVVQSFYLQAGHTM